MRNLYLEDDGSYRAMSGGEISGTIAEAIQAATDGEIALDFNGVTVRVRSDSDPALIYRDWNRALHGCIDKDIGPHPAPTLTSGEIAHDESVRAENRRKADARQQVYDRKANAKRAAVSVRLATAPPIALADPDVWAKTQVNNTDGYGAAILDYAERWARLMQAGIAEGSDVASIAKATSHDADTEGITGFMYGAAVSILAQCWEHGEALRRWHNLDTQIGDEGERANESGGTLNPALLNIGGE